MRKNKHSPKYGKLKRCDSVFVNAEGTYVECCEEGTALKIETDADGYPYVMDWYDQKVYIAEAVAMTFMKKKDFANDGWYIGHIDGDKTNCAVTNLQWIKVDASKDTPSPHVFYDNGVVGKDGTLRYGKGDNQENASLRDRCLDKDVDCIWVFETPQGMTFEAFGKPMYHDVEDALADAGYVKGDKSQFKDPVILHIDKDVENIVGDNLEWCERDDPRFVEYKKIREERQIDLIEKYNEGRSLPDSWPHK